MTTRLNVSRLLVTLLVVLTTMVGYAQDSYREAVKQYLTAIDQFENSKSLILDMSILYESDGQLDIGQLTKRYIDEQFENDMIDWFTGIAMTRDLTETDLKEVALLQSSPEAKTFEDHQKKWMGDFIVDWMMPFMTMSEKMNLDDDVDLDDDVVIDVDKDWRGHILDLLGPPTQPNADIDAAYAAKFNDVIMESVLGKSMMDALMHRLDEDVSDDPKEQESNKAFNDWMVTSCPAVLLNSAYGNLTLEDLDFAATLFSNESYCKLNSYGSTADLENQKVGHFMVKYADWMKEQGAKVTEDPAVAAKFWQALLGRQGIAMPSFGNDYNDDETDKPWYDLNLEDLEQGE